MEKKNLRDLKPVDFELDLSDLGEINLIKNKNRKFEIQKYLGIYDQHEILRELAEIGIMESLIHKGFSNLRVDIELASIHSHKLSVFAGDIAEPLIFMRLKRGTFRSKFFSENFEDLDLLFIDWLLIQDPRPPQDHHQNRLFPGQKFSGLGMFYQIRKFFSHLVISNKLDGAANIPAYFHDAILFAKTFQFIDPVTQGIFEAMISYTKRNKIKLDDFSNKIENKEIQIYFANRFIADFSFGEMMTPNSPELVAYFNSDNYKKIKNKYFRKTKFQLKGF